MDIITVSCFILIFCVGGAQLIGAFFGSTVFTLQLGLKKTIKSFFRFMVFLAKIMVGVPLKDLSAGATVWKSGVVKGFTNTNSKVNAKQKAKRHKSAEQIFNDAFTSLNTIKETFENDKQYLAELARREREMIPYEKPAFLRQALFATTEKGQIVLDEFGYGKPFSVSQLFQTDDTEETPLTLMENDEDETETNKVTMSYADKDEVDITNTTAEISDTKNVIRFPPASMSPDEHAMYFDELDDEGFEPDCDPLLLALQGR